MTDKPMNDNLNDNTSDKVDSAVAAIKINTPSNNDIDAAAERVRAVLFENQDPDAEHQGDQKQQASIDLSRQLNSTDNYLAAIPDYLANRLSPAQKVLFEEETRQSIPLRRALNAAKQQQAAQVNRPKKHRGKTLQWFASAAAIALVALGWIFVVPQLPTFDQSQLAQVEDVQGKLYQVVDGSLRELTAGSWIAGREEVRTAKNSTAMLKLDDGSLIEVNQRSEFSFTRRGRGNRIDVNRGKIIVAASPQGAGTLDVATDEFVVSVTGTIFEVGHGTNGSRVSVIEGEVQVYQEGDSTSVTPGEQFASRMGKTLLGIEDDIAWSRNADDYIAMLRDVNALQADLEAVMATEPRYSIRLLNLVPENTVVYGAVPNAPEKIAEIYTVIRDRIQQSDRLSRAVARVEMDAELETLEEVMTWIEEVGDALGEETVAALVLQQGASGNEVQPLIMSEVDAEAFRESFESQMDSFREALANNAHSYENENGEIVVHEAELNVAIVDSPADALPNQLSIWLHQDLLIASTSQEVLFAVENAIVTGGSPFMNGGLYAELLNFYNRGAEFLGAVDIEKIIALEPSQSGLQTAGIDNAQYLMVHHQQQTDRVNFTADLLFNGERRGVMSWLAEPSPMGSLEFFSGNTTFVGAFVLKDPSIIFSDIKSMAERTTGQSWDSLDTNAALARELRDNFIATLGGEVAFGLDGPAVPTPSWKLVVEVYDEILLQETIERAIALANQQAEVADKFSITPANVGVYTGYQLQFVAEFDGIGEEEILTDISVNYAYVDGYLLAAPNVPLLERAINQYQSGVGLLAEHAFQALMPQGGYLDVSALSFNRIATLINDLTKNLPTGVVLSEAQRDELRDLYMSNRGGSMISVIGERESIRLAHSGSSMFPINLPSIFSLQSVAGILIGEDKLIELSDDFDSSDNDEVININFNN
jgi:ferric-dicitrate binding protein FerR (iron transport regulator)